MATSLMKPLEPGKISLTNEEVRRITLTLEIVMSSLQGSGEGNLPMFIGCPTPLEIIGATIKSLNVRLTPATAPEKDNQNGRTD